MLLARSTGLRIGRVTVPKRAHVFRLRPAYDSSTISTAGGNAARMTLHINMYICEPVCSHTEKRAHARTHASTHTHLHTHLHTHSHTLTHTHTHTHSGKGSSGGLSAAREFDGAPLQSAGVRTAARSKLTRGRMNKFFDEHPARAKEMGFSSTTGTCRSPLLLIGLYIYF